MRQDVIKIEGAAGEILLHARTSFGLPRGVPLQPYLGVLRTPGVLPPFLLLFLTRLPLTAMGITLTLHVVSDLGRGYGAAGFIGTATTLGTAVGAPMVGRMIDRHGLRPVVAVCGLISCVYWIATPHLPYYVLLVASLPFGMLVLPASSITRQVLTALVPEEQRRTAFALDMVALEISFMIGPAAGIFVSTAVSSTAALTGIGVVFGVVSALLYVVNPPIRTADEGRVPAGARPPMRTWLSPHLIATLLIAVGALVVLIGTELAALAALRASGDVEWTGVLMVVMCLASLLGGLVYGARKQAMSQLTLMTLLSVLLLPVAFVTEPWWLLALMLIPMNVACAPTLTATTESVSRLAPPRVRGEAMGLQDSSTRTGMAIGAPFVGFVIDNAGPSWGFVAAALGGLAFAAIGLVLTRRNRARTTEGAIA